MGAGASIIDEEMKKPLDGSDVATPESAKAEVVRLRALLAQQHSGEEGKQGTEDAVPGDGKGGGGAAAALQPLSEVQGDTSKTCVERVQAALDAIAARDTGALNCCVEVLAESALAQAVEADARLAGGGERRLMEGVPILAKVNVDVAGSLSTGGMPALAEFRPDTNR